MTKRSGFIALAGRPNAGKSTLTNRLVGEKVTIVSVRPQTTRRAVRGVVTDKESQLVLTDLPGVQRPLDALTSRMQRRVERELGETDAVLFVVNAHEGVGAGDRFIAGLLRKANVPVVAAVNKIDRVSAPTLVRVLGAIGALQIADEIVPVSARTGEGIADLLAQLVDRVPEGPFLFPEDSVSDQPLAIHLAELVREQVLARTRQELPHAVEVEVEELTVRRDGMTIIRATIFVEAESQKGIVVGRAGKMIGAVGTAARAEIEQLVDGPVHLDLRVRVRRGWRGDEALLDRLGID
ncbi:MAG: GTPase Era [Solirubrobacterales bacterium]|nr:GTPase Era [Solirubrobacterales bacterium]